MGASEMLEMPLQLEFEYRYSRSIIESLKRQCSKPYLYCSSSLAYYPHTCVYAKYSDFLTLGPPNTNKLPGQQGGEMGNWRAVQGQSVRKILCEI